VSPLGRSVARFNQRVTNRLTGPVAPRLPGFGVIVHRGRRSGIERRTPVNVFRRGPQVAIALTYGTEAGWVKNVLAAGGCDLETRGRRLHLVDPRVVHDPGRRPVPAPVRVPLAALGVDDFLMMSVADGA
jgi:deazaflavin-dependent oxidoreductase (nitroreductase family)